MASDFWVVLQWWGSLFLVGAVAYPLTKRLFAGWFNHGYLFSKAVGMATVTWIVYALGTARVMPFSVWSIGVALGAVFVIGLVFNFQFSIFNFQSIFKFKFSNVHFKFQISNFKLGMNARRSVKKAFVIGLEEIFFLAALFVWSWVKGHEPELRGLEKFMDFGFMQSILNSRYFPPADMWYAGLPINYYYFGHLVTAVLTTLSGLDLSYTFNLMLATIFALTITMSFSIGAELMLRASPDAFGASREVSVDSSRFTSFSRTIRLIASGILTAFLVTLAGNMQTIYAFTRGYTGENVKPFWELLWPIAQIWRRLPEGMQTYWYANATRFIPYTIHEFPSYSFVVSDVHGHVLSLPFVLLAIGLVIQMVICDKRYVISNTKDTFHFSRFTSHFSLLFYGFLVGVLVMTNALDGAIYFGLFVLLVFILRATTRSGGVEKSGQESSRLTSFARTIVPIGLVLLVAAVVSLPFLTHFTSFVTGIAVNCPPAFLANTRIGPIIFEGVEKCQISPLWMWWLLWGFFVYCGIPLIAKLVKLGKLAQFDKMMLVFFLFALALVVFPEFFYFKDIYPAHFRSNTMFKLGYQAFILFSIVAGYVIVKTVISEKREARSGGQRFLSLVSYRLSRRAFLFFLVPQLFLVSIFPIFAVRSYFGGLKKYEGVYGLTWLAREYPEDWRAIEWLNKAISNKREARSGGQRFLSLVSYRLSPVLVEADGDSYTDYGRFSAFTGLPTIIGWPVHEWLWRGSYDVVAPRREDVRQIYESTDVEVTRIILVRYNVRYVVVGTLEREKYKSLQEWKFSKLGVEVFRSGSTVIYATY